MTSSSSLRRRLFAPKRPQQPSEHSTTTTIAVDPMPQDATLAPRRVPFYRRIASSSATPLPSSATPNIPRPSLFARVVHRVVPCVTPDPALLHQQDNNTVVPPKEDNTPPPSEMSHSSTPLPLTIPPYPPPVPADSEVIVTPPPSSHLLPEDETDGLTSGSVQPPGSTGHPSPATTTHTVSADGNDSDATTYTDDEAQLIQQDDEEQTLIRKGGSGIPIGPDGKQRPLLPPMLPKHAGKKCLVLDLDETLVHSSFKSVQQADFIVPVEIEYHWHHFHVLKRPGVDAFLQSMAPHYEIVVFTASLSKYADPVLDKLDPTHTTITHRLFRESCFSHKGNYVKDLSQLGRDVGQTIILDNSPASYIFHPRNAVPVSSWFNDPHDAELLDLVPFLEDLSVEGIHDVRGILDGAR